MGVTDLEHKQRVLGALCDHLAPGRSLETRRATQQELAGTLLVALPIAEASVKCRTGAPIDATDDLELPHWSGVVPVELRIGVPQADPTLRADVTPSAAVQRLRSAGGWGAGRGR